MPEEGSIISYRVCVYNRRRELVVQVEMGDPGVSPTVARQEARAQAVELQNLWGDGYVVEVQPVYDSIPDLVVDSDSEEGVNGAEG